MVTLSGGVTQTSNNVPLTGNVQQSVSPGSASAGGNVFNQTYAPDVTLNPRQPLTFNPTQPMSSLAPLQMTPLVGPSGSNINIPSSQDLQKALTNVPQVSATTASTTPLSQFRLGAQTYSPGQVTAQGYPQQPYQYDAPYGGGMPMQQPMMQQPRYAMQQRPLIDPATLQQMQQIMPQVQITPQMHNAQRGMWDAQAYSRQAAELSAAPIAPPTYMQNTRQGRVERAMRGLTHGGQKQMLQGQTAYYNALNNQPQQIGQAANYMRQAYHDELNYERAIEEKNAEIAARMLEKVIRIPAASAQQQALEFMFKQWPSPSTNEQDRRARLNYAEDTWQRTGIDLGAYINEDSAWYDASLDNKNKTNIEKGQRIEKNAATMDAQIETIKARASMAKDRAAILAETKQYQIDITQLNAKQKALDYQISKALAEPLKKAQLEGQRLQIQKTLSELKGEAAKNYREIDKAYETALGRYIQAAGSMDDDAKSMALENLKSFGPLKAGTEQTFRVPVLDENGHQKVDAKRQPIFRPLVLGVPQQVADARAFLTKHAQASSNGFVPPPPPVVPDLNSGYAPRSEKEQQSAFARQYIMQNPNADMAEIKEAWGYSKKKAYESPLARKPKNETDMVYPDAARWQTHFDEPDPMNPNFGKGYRLENPEWQSEWTSHIDNVFKTMNGEGGNYKPPSDGEQKAPRSSTTGTNASLASKTFNLGAQSTGLNLGASDSNEPPAGRYTKEQRRRLFIDYMNNHWQQRPTKAQLEAFNKRYILSQKYEPQMNGLYKSAPSALSPVAPGIEAHPQYNEFIQRVTQMNNGLPPTEKQINWFKQQISKKD